MSPSRRELGHESDQSDDSYCFDQASLSNAHYRAGVQYDTRSIDIGPKQMLHNFDNESCRDTPRINGSGSRSSSRDRECHDAEGTVATDPCVYGYGDGRRYHAYHAGKYLLPNDEKEQERMDLLHAVWDRVLKSDPLHKMPISPARVLDIGTGTGIWAIDMADKFPGAYVLGLDLSPIQPSWVPPNCCFEIFDIETGWPFQGQFDLIHARSLAGSIADWSRFYMECFKHLTPGGFIEIQEHEICISAQEKEMPPQ